VADWVTVAGKVPEIVTVVAALTEVVTMVKVAAKSPVGTVTVAGTGATVVLPLASETTAPPLEAGSVSVTVPVTVPPPSTLAGLRLSEAKLGIRVTVNVAVWVVLW
jgi:hypothetical protein